MKQNVKVVFTHILWINEMIPNDPYDHIIIAKGTYKERDPLSEEEIVKIREAKYTGRLARVRDLFIFMYKQPKDERLSTRNSGRPKNQERNDMSHCSSFVRDPHA